GTCDWSHDNSEGRGGEQKKRGRKKKFTAAENAVPFSAPTGIPKTKGAVHCENRRVLRGAGANGSWRQAARLCASAQAGRLWLRLVASGASAIEVSEQEYPP